MNAARQRTRRRRPSPAPAAPQQAPSLVAVRRPSTSPRTRAFGATPNELHAAAEIARRSLLAGGLESARRIFEGLAVLDPNDAYVALGLALTYDRLGRFEDAHRGYRRAADLDPTDAHADINRAELFLAHGDLASAQKLLTRAVHRARGRGDVALTSKATAMLSAICAQRTST